MRKKIRAFWCEIVGHKWCQEPKHIHCLRCGVWLQKGLVVGGYQWNERKQRFEDMGGNSLSFEEE